MLKNCFQVQIFILNTEIIHPCASRTHAWLKQQQWSVTIQDLDIAEQDFRERVPWQPGCSVLPKGEQKCSADNVEQLPGSRGVSPTHDQRCFRGALLCSLRRRYVRGTQTKKMWRGQAGVQQVTSKFKTEGGDASLKTHPAHLAC